MWVAVGMALLKAGKEKLAKVDFSLSEAKCRLFKEEGGDRIGPVMKG